MFKDLLGGDLRQLAANPYYYKRFKLYGDPRVSASIIYNTIAGMYTYLQRIYGSDGAPKESCEMKEFSELYEKLKHKRKNCALFDVDSDPVAAKKTSSQNEAVAPIDDIPF